MLISVEDRTNSRLFNCLNLISHTKKRLTNKRDSTETKIPSELNNTIQKILDFKL